MTDVTVNRGPLQRHIPRNDVRARGRFADQFAYAEEQQMSDRVVALTGAGGGLGREVAVRQASAGASVACSDVNPDALERTVRLVADAGGRATGSVVDVSVEEEVVAWRDETMRKLGAPNVLINCGGILDRRGIADTSLDDFMRVIAINLGGCYSTIRAFAPAMAAGGWGRIVNIASIAGLTGYPFAAYAASKAGVVNLTRSVLLDLWGTGVTVNAVCPGAMTTPMLDVSVAHRMEIQTPTGVLADPRDVAELVRFLCSDAAKSINGSSLVVDGGATAFFAYATGGAES